MDALRAVRQKGQLNCPLALMELLAPPYDTSTITATITQKEGATLKRNGAFRCYGFTMNVGLDFKAGRRAFLMESYDSQKKYYWKG